VPCRIPSGLDMPRCQRARGEIDDHIRQAIRRFCTASKREHLATVLAADRVVREVADEDWRPTRSRAPVTVRRVGCAGRCSRGHKKNADGEDRHEQPNDERQLPAIHSRRTYRSLRLADYPSHE